MKPHIKLMPAEPLFRFVVAEGYIWCAYASRTSRRPFAMSRSRENIYKAAARRAPRAP